ncbi:MAG: threonine-phosphate decarboxylase CobD [Pseudomonadota bacterium]
MTPDLTHGGALDIMRAAYPNAREPWIDLSTGINPWPYPHCKITAEALAHLPTRAAQQSCLEAMATAMGTAPKALLLAPGSELLIRLLPDVIKPARVAVLSPTYGDHKAVWTRAGAEVIETYDPLAHASTADAVVITHPNNPDGRLFDKHALEEARRTLAQRSGWLIVDEAYADLMPKCSLLRSGTKEALLVLRSFGKFFGLAGLRLGAMSAPEPVKEAMAERLGVWPVSGAALEIGARAYADLAWQAETRKRLHEAANRLDAILRSNGLEPVGGTALYRFVRALNAHDIFDSLARQGIYVRRFAWTDKHLRIGLPATTEAAARLQAALSLLT